MAVATPCLQLPHSSTTTMSTLKPASNDAVLLFRCTVLGTSSSSSCKLYRSRSYEFRPKKMNKCSIRRVCSMSFENFENSNSSLNDEEFSKKIEDLAFRVRGSDENLNFIDSQSSFGLIDEDVDEIEEEAQSLLMEIQSIGMKAKSLDLPLSLRMIKRKKNQWRENLIEAQGNVCCSVKKAFSSMVFIIRELHSFTLQMREALFYEDLQGILVRVQREMHASFVWLFQQVFSHTPTLMVYIMILLANFTVNSISDSAAFAAVAPPVATVEEREIDSNFNFEISTMNRFTVTKSSTSGSKIASIGGNNGGGNNAPPVASGMDGDSWLNDNSASVRHHPIQSDGVTREDTWQIQDEMKLWKEIVDEASRMRSEFTNEDVIGDSETLKRFVSPVTAKIEADEYEDYFKTELLYQNGLAQEPNNVLLLANYAQFLYLVVRDFDRAEEYFKRAVKVEPKDAEAYNKYATFLWQVKNDLWAAEETFLEAISVDPSNSYYAANYAHFLWNTGGEDTCFPLDSHDDETLDA